MPPVALLPPAQLLQLVQPPLPPEPPVSSRVLAARVLWAFVLARHTGLGLAVTIWWAEQPITFSHDFPFSPIDDGWLLLAIVVAGFFAGLTALVSDIVRSHHEWGTLAGALSLSACITPGLVSGVGIVGIAFSLAALLLHLSARPEFRVSEDRAAYAAHARA